MGRGRSGRVGLQRIDIDDRWYFNPNNADFEVDENDIVKNPIKFVGVGKDTEIGELIDGYGTIQIEYKNDVEVDIDKLLTLQPFVLRSGIMGNDADSMEGLPYAVLLDGKYYLVDGNHRVAKAKLKGRKKVRIDVSVLERT